MRCSTKPTCHRGADMLVQCKGFDGAQCPTEGPSLDITPPLNQLDDCVAGGSYTVTIGGTWADGTLFSWKVGDIPPGITAPTSNHTDTFVLSHPAGSPRRILIAEVEALGCGDVESVVLFPPAQDVAQPDTVGFTIASPGVTRTVSWTAGDGSIPVTGLPPGPCTVLVTAPTGADHEWFVEGGPVPTAVTNELTIPDLAASMSTTVAVVVQVPCAAPLLPVLILSAEAVAVPPGPIRMVQINLAERISRASRRSSRRRCRCRAGSCACSWGSASSLCSSPVS